MTDILPPAPKFRIRRWVIATVVTTSLVCGALSAVAVSLLADRFFDIGHDPAVTEAPRDTSDTEFEKRLRALEENAAKPNIVFQAETPVQTTESAPAVTPVQNDTTMAQIIVGITQLKTAYDSDTSLQPAIATLQQAVKDGGVQENLKALSDLVGENLPSKKSLQEQIMAMQTETHAPQAAPAEATGDWKTRTKTVLNRFVKIQDTATLQARQKTGATLNAMHQAIGMNDYATAAQLGASLPDTAQSRALMLQIQTRLQAQQLVHKTIAAVSSALGQPQGSLY